MRFTHRYVHVHMCVWGGTEVEGRY